MAKLSKVELVVSTQSDKQVVQLLRAIMASQQTMQDILNRLETIMASVLESVQAYAAQVNDFSNAAAAAIGAVQQQIADLRAQLVSAATPEAVDAILQPAIASLTPIRDSLLALAAGGQPTIPEEPL